MRHLLHRNRVAARFPGIRIAVPPSLVLATDVFDEFLRDKLLSLGLVSNIESRIVIRGVKNSTAVPLGLISPYVSPLG